MAFTFRARYSSDGAAIARAFYATLSEKDPGQSHLNSRRFLSELAPDFGKRAPIFCPEAKNRSILGDLDAIALEKDRRRFAALEARRLGHGGIAYVAVVLDLSRRTIERGLGELDELPRDPAAGRVRRPGGGRKKRSRPNPTSKTI